jgi:hypothetical protein
MGLLLTRDAVRARILARLAEFGELSLAGLANYCNGYQAHSRYHFEPCLRWLVRDQVVIADRRQARKNGPVVTYYRLAAPSSGATISQGRRDVT